VGTFVICEFVTGHRDVVIYMRDVVIYIQGCGYLHKGCGYCIL
jgi:G:T-mismatch repair DNA endonuclease (very short patch repair protein)